MKILKLFDGFNTGDYLAAPPDANDTVVGAASAQTLTNKTLTSPVVNAPTGTKASETVIATNVITAAESGKVFFLNAATEFASTLPVPAAGLHYKFIVTAAPASADYTIGTNAAAQNLAGQVHESSGGDGDSEAAATANSVNFVDGTAVIGDMVDVWSDGTSWFAQCFCDAAGGITITG